MIQEKDLKEVCLKVLQKGSRGVAENADPVEECIRYIRRCDSNRNFEHTAYLLMLSACSNYGEDLLVGCAGILAKKAGEMPTSH